MERVKIEVSRIKPKKAFDTAKVVYQIFSGVDSLDCFKGPNEKIKKENYEAFRRKIDEYKWRYGDEKVVGNRRRQNKRKLGKKKRVVSREVTGDIRDMCLTAANRLLPQRIPKEVQQFFKYDGEGET